jgi:Tfp pilus assembly protein PilO
VKKSLLGGGWAAIVPLTLAIGVYLVVVFFPTMREISSLRAETATKEATIAEAAKQSGLLPQLEKDLAATRRYLNDWRGISARPGESAQLFGQLADLVKASGATTTVFRPEAKRAHASIERLPLVLGCRGTHDQIHAVLAAVERLPARIWVDEVSLERADQDGEFVSCELRLAIFADNFEISDQVDSAEVR